MPITAADSATSPPPAQAIDSALLRLAGILLVGAVVVQLDATIVSVALNRLGRAFHTTSVIGALVNTGTTAATEPAGLRL